jgi:hypothetical protein
MTQTPDAPFSFEQIDGLLAAHLPLWLASPFINSTPDWSRDHPRLYQALLSLTDADYQALLSDDDQCLQWLIGFLPALADLTHFRRIEATTPLTRDYTNDHPRKQKQVEAFSHFCKPQGARIIEWCAGQGWLLEGLARRYPTRQLEGLEWQARLCEQANQRFTRCGITAQIHCADVLRDDLTTGKQDSLVALHACGHLHQALIRHVEQHRPIDLALSPCCYHLGYRDALSQKAGNGLLQAQLLDRHLAVQDISGGHGNRQRRAQQGGEWRWGYELLRQHLTGETRYRPSPSWPGALWQGSFANFCLHNAQHHGLSLPPQLDFSLWQNRGKQHYRAVRRLELLRRQFRRLLEWWMVLDAGWSLCEQGYQVSIRIFCAQALTPRNLIIIAQRAR